MSSNPSEYYSQAQSQKLPVHTFRQTTCHDQTTSIGKSAQMQIAKSQCLNNENQIALLLEAISKYETQIRDKERYYTKIASDIAVKLEMKANQNKKIKQQIYQLKSQAKQIKKQCQQFQNGNKIRVQKCFSARDLVLPNKAENSLQNCKSTTAIYRMTLPSKNQMF